MIGVVAHRGGALLWPENSRAACVGAASLGVDEIQLDVHATDAGAIVVIHDATLERTTTADGAVATLTPQALRAVRLRDGGEALPVLDALVRLIRPQACLLRLELKRPQAGQRHGLLLGALREVLQTSAMLSRTVICGFSLEDVVASRAKMPAFRHVWLWGTAALAEQAPDGLLRDAVTAGVDGVGMRWNAVPDRFVERVHQDGLTLDLFGCNDDMAIQAAIATGADTLSTDRPDLALRYRLSQFRAG